MKPWTFECPFGDTMSKIYRFGKPSPIHHRKQSKRAVMREVERHICLRRSRPCWQLIGYCSTWSVSWPPPPPLFLFVPFFFPPSSYSPSLVIIVSLLNWATFGLSSSANSTLSKDVWRFLAVEIVCSWYGHVFFLYSFIKFPFTLVFLNMESILVIRSVQNRRISTALLDCKFVRYSDRLGLYLDEDLHNVATFIYTNSAGLWMVLALYKTSMS